MFTLLVRQSKLFSNSVKSINSLRDSQFKMFSTSSSFSMESSTNMMGSSSMSHTYSFTEEKRNYDQKNDHNLESIPKSMIPDDTASSSFHGETSEEKTSDVSLGSGPITQEQQQQIPNLVEMSKTRRIEEQRRLIHSRPQRRMKPSLIIFDKDGTLIGFDQMWASWAEQFAMRLESQSGLQIREELYRLLGYDHLKRTVVSGGALCCTPMHQLRSLGEAVLMRDKSFGHTQESARKTIDEIWHMPDPRDVHPLVDLPVLFQLLKSFNMKIAVCTTDDHDATVATMEHLGVSHLVDMIVGGDDPLPPKPAAEQIWHICNQLGVRPSNTIMVGDTNTDMEMGRNAGVGLSVGVLDGASSIKDLILHADVLVPDLTYLTKIVMQFGFKAEEEEDNFGDAYDSFVEKEKEPN